MLNEIKSFISKALTHRSDCQCYSCQTEEFITAVYKQAEEKRKEESNPDEDEITPKDIVERCVALSMEFGGKDRAIKLIKKYRKQELNKHKSRIINRIERL